MRSMVEGRAGGAFLPVEKYRACAAAPPPPREISGEEF
jgi:hypothetical protein